MEILKKYFGVESSINKIFQTLEEDFEKKELNLDQVLDLDSQEISQDDHYFVFQEITLRIAKIFVRDKDIPKKLRVHTLITPDIFI